MRIKCFPKFGGGVEEVFVDDGDDADDFDVDGGIIPASLCNVVMED